MKIKDLDEIILEKRDALFLTGNLEIENSFEEISLGEICIRLKLLQKCCLWIMQRRLKIKRKPFIYQKKLREILQ